MRSASVSDAIVAVTWKGFVLRWVRRPSHVPSISNCPVPSCALGTAVAESGSLFSPQPPAIASAAIAIASRGAGRGAAERLIA